MSLTRRHFLAASASLPFAAATAPALAAPPPAPAWSHAAYLEAMAASGRETKLSEASFRAIQARRTKALATIQSYLRERLGSADPEVMRAFAEVPR
ncbi:MAG: protein-L-isoaspartate O-methyltransferase, partial [Alphaproteobacteria bacterium]